MRDEGVRALYAGVLPSLLKDCPYAAVYLLLYTSCKEQLTDMATSTACRSHSNGSTSAAALPPFDSSVRSKWRVSGQAPIIQFVSAFCAATVATVAFQPLEVLKTRMQLSSTDAASTSSFSRFRSLSVSLYRTGGASAFFVGLVPRVMRRSLSNAIAWSLFEQIYSFWSGTVAI